MYFLKNKSDEIALVSHLNKIQTVDSLERVSGVYLHKHNGALSISDTETPKVLPIAVDFLKTSFKKRLTSSRIKSELLNKTLGKKHDYKTLIDATAGMGVDSMLFAALGLEVTAYEKSEVIYSLLNDGLARARQTDDLCEVASRVNLVLGNSLDHKGSTDVLYLDFMFSKQDKKAKSKKGMEVFKKITTTPTESELLDNFTKYSEFKFKRLVFKRPLKAEVLKIGNFSHSVAGKAIRYDIYLP